MKLLTKSISLLSLVVLGILLLVSCVKTEKTSVSVKPEADTYSPIVLAFEDKIKASSEEKTEENKYANITNEEVIKALQAKFETRKPNFFKYEDGLLKAFFADDNKPLESEKLTVLKGLPVYSYMEGKYTKIAETSNELKLKLEGTKFVLDQAEQPAPTPEVVTRHVELKYVLTNKDQNYAYKATNATVVSWEKSDTQLLVKYSYTDSQNSMFELYTTEQALENNMLKEVSESNKKVFSKEISVENKESLKELEHIYLMQGHEDLINFSYEKGKKQIYVLFASNAISQEQEVNVHVWNIEPASTWPGHKMNIVNREKNVFSILLNTPDTTEDKKVGLLFNINENTKLTGDVTASEHEAISNAVTSEDEVSFVFVTSSKISEDNELLSVYSLSQINDFLEYIK